MAKGWGTQVTLDLGRMRGPLDCELVAVSKAGERWVVTGWSVPVPGYGIPGHPADLLVRGGTSIPVASLGRVRGGPAERARAAAHPGLNDPADGQE